MNCALWSADAYGRMSLSWDRLPESPGHDYIEQFQRVAAHVSVDKLLAYAPTVVTSLILECLEHGKVSGQPAASPGGCIPVGHAFSKGSLPAELRCAWTPAGLSTSPIYFRRLADRD